MTSFSVLSHLLKTAMLFKKNDINLSSTTLVELCLSWAVKLNCHWSFPAWPRGSNFVYTRDSLSGAHFDVIDKVELGASVWAQIISAWCAETQVTVGRDFSGLFKYTRLVFPHLLSTNDIGYSVLMQGDTHTYGPVRLKSRLFNIFRVLCNC